MVSTLNWILMAQADIAEAVNSAVESAPAEVTEAVANATSTSVSLNWLDWAVIIGYFAIIAGVAIWSSRGQNTSSDFFLGGRNIGWFAIGGSIDLYRLFKRLDEKVADDTDDGTVEKDEEK